MTDTINWVASDTAIRPRVELTRDGVPVDLTAASLIGLRYRHIVASGVTPVVASYLATVYATAPDSGVVECLTYAAAPLATAGQWRSQVVITSAAGTETFETPFTVIIGARF